MINAQQKALVIIDIQNDYFEGGSFPLVNSDAAALKAKEVLEYFRKENLPVIHIQHISAHPEATFFLPNTKGVEIHESVKPKAGEKVTQKYYPNSFRETSLANELKALNVSELVFCGMMTSMCVDATVRAAKDFGYECTVIGDACAAPNLSIKDKTVNGADVSTAFLAALNYFYANVINAKDYTISK